MIFFSDASMDVVASNPENEATAEKAVSDSESTGSNDSLNAGFSNGEQFEFLSIPPHTNDHVTTGNKPPNSEQNQAEKTENVTENVSEETGDSSMLASVVMLSLDSPNEQIAENLNEPEPELINKFDQALAFPENSFSPVAAETRAELSGSNQPDTSENSNNSEEKSDDSMGMKRKLPENVPNRIDESLGESQTSDNNAIVASPFKQSKIAGTSENYDELTLSHDSQPANSLNASGDTDKQQEPAIEADYVSTANDSTETNEVKKASEAAKAFDDEQKDASGHEESTRPRRRSHGESKAGKVLSDTSSTSSPVRKKVHQIEKTGENENHDQVEQSRNEDKSGEKTETENEERAVEKDTTASESKKEIEVAASNLVSDKEGQKFLHQESENEDSKSDDDAEEEEEEEDEDEKAMMLINVKENKTKKKADAVEFIFSVGPDIFDLGLDNENLYCGVVIVLESKTNGRTELFYPGKWLNLNISKRKLEMMSYVPRNDLKSENGSFSFYFAVSQCKDKNVVANDPHLIRVSQNGKTSCNFESSKSFNGLENMQYFVKKQLDENDEKSQTAKVIVRKTKAHDGDASKYTKPRSDEPPQQDNDNFHDALESLDSSHESTRVNATQSDDRNLEQPGNNRRRPRSSNLTSSEETENERTDRERFSRSETGNQLSDGQLYAQAAHKKPDLNALPPRSSDETKNEMRISCSSRGKVLQEIKKHDEDKAKSIKFTFLVDNLDISDVDLEGDEVYCGVVAVFTTGNQRELKFYAGEIIQEELVDKKLTTMTAYLPTDHLKGYSLISYYYAVSTLPFRNSASLNPPTVSFSSTGEHQLLIDQTLPQLHAKATGVVQQFTRLKLTGYGTKSYAEASTSNVPSNTTDANLKGSHFNETTEKSEDVLDRVKNAPEPFRKIMPFWRFLFQVGPEILQLGLSGDLFCGVLIIGKREGISSGLFYPGSKVKQNGDLLEIEVVIPKEEIDLKKTFKSAYAVSQTPAKIALLQNPHSVAQQKEMPVIRQASEPGLVDDRKERISFNVPVQAKSNKSSDKPMAIKRVQHKNNASTKESQTSKQSESALTKSWDEESDDNLFKNGFTLKDIIGNPWRDSHRETSNNKFAELNVIVDSDICLLGQRKLLVGVKTSIDNFQKVTPGYIIGEIDGCFWVRIHVDMKYQNALFYKYVVSSNIQGGNTFWEVAYPKGPYNRYAINSQLGQKLVKFDGVATFVKRSEEQKRSMLSKYGRKFVDLFTTGSWESSDKTKSFYRSQNMTGLGLYLRLCFQKFCSSNNCEIVGNYLAVIVSSLCSVTVTLNYNFSSPTVLMNDEELMLAIFKNFLLIYDECKMNNGEETDSLETQLVIIAILFLIESLNSRKYTLQSVSDEIYHSFLRSAMFHSEASKNSLAQFISEYVPVTSAIRNSCDKLLDVKAIQKNKFYPVLLEWLSIVVKSNFIKMPYELNATKDVVENLTSYYTSSFTKSQLLLLFFSQKWQNFKLIEMLNLSVGDILECYYFYVSNNRVSTKDKKLIELLNYMYQTIIDEKIAISEKTCISFLDGAGKILTIMGRNNIQSFEIGWFNNFIATILDFIELFEARGIVFLAFQNKFLLENFLKHTVNVYLKTVNDNDTYFIAKDVIKEWGSILKPRLNFSSESRDIIESTTKQTLFAAVRRKWPGSRLVLLYANLPEAIAQVKKENPHFDPSGVEAFFQEAIIQSFNDYVSENKYQYDLQALSKWPEHLSTIFVEIVSRSLPPVAESMHAYDVVRKMVGWKPFIALIHLATLCKTAEEYLRDHFLIVRNSFNLVLTEIEEGAINFTFFQEIITQLTTFQKICVNMLLMKQDDFEFRWGNCKSLANTVDASFRNVWKLKELVTKFRGRNIQIDMNELEETVKNWQQKPLNSFAKIDRRGKVILTCTDLDEGEVNAMERFMNYMNSRVFSDMAFKELQRPSQDENQICTYKQLLNEFLAVILFNYLKLADSLASGDIIAETAQHRFKPYRENEKKEEINFMFEFLTERVIDEKKKDELKAVKEIRMDQVLKLDTLRKNKEFVQALLDLKEVLGIEKHFPVLDTLSKLVGGFIAIHIVI